MASVTHDDGFHEIQLNGKQLVFLFMAVTVVSVVIFLCGVLVGRGVRLDRGVVETVSAEAESDALPPVTSEAGTAPTGQPIAGNEKLDYTKNLEAATPPPDRIDPPSAKAEPIAEAPPSAPPAAVSSASSAASSSAPSASSAASSSVPSAAPSPAPPAAPKAAAAPAAAEPPGPGLAVQVAAYRVRGEADALAQRLIGKSYKAYVVPPAPGAPALFRVRVGKFKEQREADQVVAKLKKEEKFDPWIVR